MNVQNLINQQLGILRWTHCDSMLSRLESRQNDENKYILNELDSAIDSPIFACKFSERQGYEHLLALANEEGKVAIYDTTGKTERYGKNIHHNAIFDVAWQPDSSRIITASGDNTAVLLDIAEAELKITRLFYGHSRSVKTVAFRGKSDPFVFSSGSRDGTIILWDIRAERANSSEFISYPDTMIVNSHLRSHSKAPNTPQSRYGSKRLQYQSFRDPRFCTISGSDSVTCIAFADQNSLVSCGAGDGVIKIWDMRKTYLVSNRTPTPRQIISYAGNKARAGYTNLLVDQNSLRLYASCLDNVVYCHNLTTLDDISDDGRDKVLRYTGYQNATFFVKSALSPCGRYMISGSSDQHAYIWNIADAIEQPIMRLRGHMAEVTCVAWMDCVRANRGAPFTVVTCSDDMHHRVWRLSLGDSTEGRYETGENDVTGFADVLKHEKPMNVKKRLRITSKTVIINRNNKRHKACENCGIGKRPADFALQNENKHFLSDKGPRRLFGNLNYNGLRNELLDKSADENLKSPPKNKRKRRYSSDCELEDIIPFSPTTNLPNFVVDGDAPHLNFSPQKRKSIDWLTKLRTEKHLVKKIKAQGVATTLGQDTYLDPSVSQLNEKEGSLLITPKTPRVDSLAKKARRRSSCNSPKTSLYNYFKVTNNGQVSPKPASLASQTKITSENPSQ